MDSSPEKKELTIHTIPDKYYLGKTPKQTSKTAMIALIVLVVIALGLAGAYFLTRGTGDDTTNTPTNTVANQPQLNRNRNTNGVANANGNANTNQSNANTAVNNTNAPVNTVTNSIFNSNTNTGTNTNSVRVPDSKDSDRDGLTDVEELLYGTGRDTPDSDLDSFSDGVELVSGYSPRGPGKLADTNLVKSYIHTSFGYSLLYPTTWTAAPNPQSTNGIIFSTDTGEFINVDVESNLAKLSARDWYLKVSPGVDTRSISSIQNTSKSLEGVLTLDGQTAYYTSGDKAYIISYNTNLLTAANFRKTFEMTYKSFALLVTAPGATNSSTTNQSNTNTTNVNASSGSTSL